MSMRYLSDVFTPDAGFFVIRNGLTINKGKLFNVSGLDRDMLARLVNLSSRLGIELSGMTGAVTGHGETDAVTVAVDPTQKEARARICVERGGLRLSAVSGAALDRAVEYFVTRFPFITQLITVEDAEKHLGGRMSAILLDGDTPWASSVLITGDNWEREFTAAEIDALPAGREDAADSYQRAKERYHQALDKRVRVEEYAAENAEAVLSVSLRIAMENFETVYPFADNSYGVPVMFQPANPGEACLIAGEKGGLIFRAAACDMEDLARRFCLMEEDPFDNQLRGDIESILSVENEIGQAVKFLAGDCWGEGKKRLVTREYARGMVDREALSRYLDSKTQDGTELKNFNDPSEINRWEYERVWEGDAFMRAFNREVLPQVKPGDQIKVRAVLGEDADVREALSQRLNALIKEAGAAKADVRIYRAYKSGYSWIEEDVLPAIENMGASVKKVKVSFRYFMNALHCETFEDESSPNYNVHQDQSEKWFDIPTRWLMELYPIDEILAKRLGISVDDVEFVRNDNQSSDYCLEAFAADGGLLYRDGFSVKYIEKYYMNKYPKIGKTHVTTGWLSAARNGEAIADTRIVTDAEQVWSILEEHIIPAMEQYMLQEFGVGNLLAAQPFFSELRMDISLSEMDYAIGVREEGISMAEAMQEDIYFYLLDWFKTYGERECGAALDNVGFIMPNITVRKGQKTEVTVTLYQEYAGGACVECGGKRIPLTRQQVDLIPVQLAFKGSIPVISYRVEGGEAMEKAIAFSALMDAGVLDLYQTGPCVIKLNDAEREATVAIPAHRAQLPSLTDTQRIHMLENDVISYDGYLTLLRWYEGRRGLHVTPVDTTYKGRKIFAVECIHRTPGVCYARNKLMSERITSLFSARHHGNESSSLNSTFMLLDRLLDDAALNWVLDKVNLIFVPFENIDGGELHYRVHKEHPRWFCHPARYNSAGFEFRKDYNNPNSKYGEARAVVKLWKKWLFDFVTDNHGFEGHELTQPFSGYISPWYKSFWIPRALYYGYIWYSEKYPHMERVGNAMRRKVSAYMNSDKEIYGLNQICAERFYKYAEAWYPEMFRTEKFDDVIYYWIESTKRPRTANFGLNQPEITTIDWTTEVADETVCGAAMELNARAHLLSDLAMLDVMKDARLIMDTGLVRREGATVCARFRRRPLYGEE